MDFSQSNDVLSNQKTVSIAFQFERIGEIDTLNEKYSAWLKIEASWEDDKHIENYNSDIDWNPGLSIENVIQQNECNIRYEIEYNNEIKTTKITEIKTIKGK
jgi:hypothetical protein